jgi:peptide chain release factor 1
MIDKLGALEKKYEELIVLLADPAVLADQAIYQKHAKTHRDLHAIVEKFREYKDILQGIEDAKALSSSESDPEMRINGIAGTRKGDSERAPVSADAERSQ